MTVDRLHAPSPISPFPTPQSPSQILLRRRAIALSCSRRFSFRFPILRRRHDSTFKAVRSSLLDGWYLEAEDAELLLASCITRTMPPALTLEQGLDKIKEAVEELKSKPPPSIRGIYRFQVAVPPDPKALNWFCNQRALLGVFPQVFVSTEVQNPTSKLLSLGRTRGVFGIGAAFFFKSSYSCVSTKDIQSRRDHSFDSTLFVAYGLLDSMFSSFKKEDPDSFYFFMPQMELVESEGLSMLFATLAWSDAFSYAFEDAVLHMSNLFTRLGISAGELPNFYVNGALRKFNIAEDKSAQLICVNAAALRRKDDWLEPKELGGASCSHQFCLRLSPTVAISKNMLDHVRGLSCSLRDYANINTLWASLVVEEFCRLGLTLQGPDHHLFPLPLRLIPSQHALRVLMSDHLHSMLLVMLEVVKNLLWS